jgi:hypothetical protein
VIAFKVDPALASVLQTMPNRSEFIRSAVQARLANACPLCRGTGVAPREGVHDDLTRLVQQHPTMVCAGCGVREPRPCHAPGEHAADARLDVLEEHGVFYCDSCFGELDLCRACAKPLQPQGRGRGGLCKACRGARG